jgi:hypothetical protein
MSVKLNPSPQVKNIVKVFENMVLKRTFMPEREEVMGGCK